MHFTSLRLSGFKSFVDQTELAIQPGLTGIVGPNGCGKSNLVEALRWVMGETSAKSLRGGAMDDVIFAGTNSRPPRAQCEVTVVLDNAERRAPAPFNDDDVLEITRRIVRDSGSGYRINGREVRARDVQLLFADLATGAQSTAMVSQGRIGELIAARPTARRRLLEEAAGIRGLHSRRHEAELRLKAATTNLERLDDVLGELQEQLSRLQKQARQARRFRNISADIRKAEGILLHLHYRQIAAERDEARARRDQALRQVAELTAAASAAAARLAETEATLLPLQEREAVTGAVLQRLKIEAEQIESEEKRLNRRLRETATRREQILGDAARERERLEEAEAVIAELTAELQGMDGEDGAAEEEQRLQACNERIARLNAEVETAHAAHEKAIGTLSRIRAERDAATARHQQAKAALQTLQQRLDEARRRAGSAPAGVSKQDHEAARKAFEEANARLKAAEEARKSCRKAHEKAREEEEVRHQALRAAESALQPLTVEADTLRRLSGREEEGTGAPPGDENVLNRRIGAAPGYETALGAVLGEDLEASTDEGADLYWGEAAASPSTPLPEGARPLLEYVSAPERLHSRLSQIGIVADNATGDTLYRQLHPGQRLVSPDGACWRWDGLIRRRAAPSRTAVLLEQRNRLAALEERIATARARAEEARREADAAKAALKESAEALRMQEQACDACRRERDRARDHMQKLAAELERRRTAEAALQARIVELEEDLRQARTAAETTETALKALPDEAPLLQRAEKARTGLDDAREHLRRAEAEAAALREQIRQHQARRQRLQRDIAQWRQRLEKGRQHLKDLQNRLKETEREREQLAARPGVLAERRQALLGKLALAEKERDEAVDALHRVRDKLGEARLQEQAAQKNLADARAALAGLESDCRHHQERLEEMAARILESLECAPEAILGRLGIGEGEELPDAETCERRLERWKRERQNMGAVNLRAEAEAQETTERIEALTAEKEDLEAAIGRLRRAIANLNREGRERLLAAFERVDAHFQKLFVRVFGGGRAHLSLTEAEDPLEAGLEIMASPPGKRLQLMSLLSGGEQALTALALLFAVFLTNPAPICVLDEVDAPLDDANVERLCRLLEDICRQTATRFLCVTHHPLTMARMDRLFGVTMAERGISQLVSVDLSTAEEWRDSA